MADKKKEEKAEKVLVDLKKTIGEFAEVASEDKVDELGNFLFETFGESTAAKKISELSKDVNTLTEDKQTLNQEKVILENEITDLKTALENKPAENSAELGLGEEEPRELVEYEISFINNVMKEVERLKKGHCRSLDPVCKAFDEYQDFKSNNVG